MIYKNLTEHIGNTPLLEIPFEVHKIHNLHLYAKLELFNPWGSVKDRSAFGMLKDYITGNSLEKRVIESSSSNTAKALQALAIINGTSVKTITNRIKVQEQRDILKLMGTEIAELPGKSECPDPNDPNNPQLTIEREIKDSGGNYIYTDQYNNENNRKIHYETTAGEIISDLGSVDYVIGGLGTTGSIGGISQRLKESNPNLIGIGVVSSSNDFIPGIRTNNEVLEVGLFKPEEYNEIITVTAKEAVHYSLALIRQMALLAGPTSGASLAGAIKYFKNVDLKSPKTGVFIACDRAENYISYYKERSPEIFGLGANIDWTQNLKILSDLQVMYIDAKEISDVKDTLIVDLRSPISYKIAHIPNSINIPFEELGKNFNDGIIPFSRTNRTLFVCAVGEKSLMVASYLKEKGYQSNSLRGGVIAWRDNNYPIEKENL